MSTSSSAKSESSSLFPIPVKHPRTKHLQFRQADTKTAGSGTHERKDAEHSGDAQNAEKVSTTSTPAPAGRDVAVRLLEERDYLDDGDPTKDSTSRPDSL